MTTNMAILCVDDERIVLNSLETQLRSYYGHKYQLEFAENANEGIEVLDELSSSGHYIVVVISDWLMPGMRGDEFLIEVHRRLPKTINIMLTGHADPSAVKNARENANLYECICKPWDAKYLTNIIDKALQEHAHSFLN
ncbi:MAG: response regulator [Phycisphaerae bacterium]|nr:response regulator [Phycisphaerae bacterium]